MKRITEKRFYIAILVLSIMMAMGCSLFQSTTETQDVEKTFLQKSHEIVRTSKLTYDLITDSVIDLHKQGIISDSDYAKVEKYADIYADAHNAAIDALTAYSVTKSYQDKDTASQQLVKISAALSELMKSAAPYMKLLK